MTVEQRAIVQALIGHAAAVLELGQALLLEGASAGAPPVQTSAQEGCVGGCPKDRQKAMGRGAERVVMCLACGAQRPAVENVNGEANETAGR
ncbi:MAG TPA: hypothetical protein VM364_08045 [Vicinamibacterales bacterium]|nr:hypothetical protein [Vicinamibacterales bacterium]